MKALPDAMEPKGEGLIKYIKFYETRTPQRSCRCLGKMARRKNNRIERVLLNSEIGYYDLLPI
jgi:hypothetical protein